MQRYQQIICDKQYQNMIEKISDYEKDREFCCHTLEHFCDVARIMYILALEEGNSLDQDIIYATALLHDIGRVWEYEKGIPHEQASVEIAKKLLLNYGYEDNEIRIIITAIGAHRKEEKEKNELADYLYRADKLSRNCFACKAKDRCKWSEEKKNVTLIL